MFAMRFFLFSLCLLFFPFPSIGEEIINSPGISLPNKIVINQDISDGLADMFVATLENKTDRNISQIIFSVDADHFVDTALVLRLGELAPGEKKEVEITSVFNNFIASWDGDPPVTLQVSVNYSFDGTPKQISRDIPVVLDTVGNHGSGSQQGKGIGTTIRVKTEPGPDNLADKSFSPIKAREKSDRVERRLVDAPITGSNRYFKTGRSHKRPIITGSVFFGKVTSVLEGPLAGVLVKLKDLKLSSTTDYDGLYTIPIVKGNHSIVLERDGFWPVEVKVSALDDSAQELADISMVPRLSKDKVFYANTTSWPQELRAYDYTMKGQLTDAYVGFKATEKEISSLDTVRPILIYIAGENTVGVQNNFVYQRIVKRDTGRVRTIFGTEEIIKLDLFVAASDSPIPLSIDSIQGGRAYQVRPKVELPPSTYALSNVLDSRFPLDVMFTAKPQIYPMRIRNYHAPKIVIINPEPASIVANRNIIDDAHDGEAVVADVELQNIANTWYLVTVDPNVYELDGYSLAPISFPENFERVFLVPPSPLPEKISSIRFSNMKFPPKSSLRFQVSRINETVALVVSLDMIYRGFLGQKLNSLNLEKFSEAVKRLSGSSDILLLQLRDLLSACANRDWEHARRTLSKIVMNMNKEGLKAAISLRKVDEIVGNKLLDELKMASNVLGAMIAAENFKLMGELAGFTIDAPESGEIIIYAK